MELPKSETQKNDRRSPSKIPPPTKDVSALKTMASKVSKTVSPQSKIPKRDVGTFSISRRRTAIGTKPVPKTKPIDSEKPSISLASLSTANSPRGLSLLSTRSNLTSQRSDHSVRSREITPRSQASIHSKDKNQKPSCRVAAKNNVLAFTNIKDKVQAYQTEFMRKWEVVKDDLPKDEGEYKLIGLVKSNEGHLLAKNATKIKIKVKTAQKNLNDFQKVLQDYVQNNLNVTLDCLDQLKTSCSGKIGDSSTKGEDNIEEVKMKIKNDNLQALGDILKIIEDFEASECKQSELTADSQTVDSQTVDSQTVNSQTVDSQTVDSQMVNAELEAKLTKLVEEVDECKEKLDQSQKELLRIKKELGRAKDELEEKDRKLINKQRELDEDAEKHMKLSKQLTSYKERAKNAETEVQNLRQNIKELESKLESAQSKETVPEKAREELCRLQRNDTDKSHQIEVLQMELTKAQFQNQKLEEKIVMDRKLLKVRSSIIESLQSKEQIQNSLSSEVGERNRDIQMLKTELLTKTEEYQNLFSTLRTKQLELTRQEHVITLLEESNERVQTLRVKQEAKIERLEEEIDQLKKIVGVYQDAVLPNEALRKNLLMVEASRDNDVIDTLGYYLDERRRKRHIDIKVKKYEK